MSRRWPGGPVMVTGANGFIGTNLVLRLLGDGAPVHVLLRDRAAAWRLEEVLARVQVHEVNLADPEGVLHVVERIRPRVIFHLAAYGAYPFQQDLRRIFQTNLEGTINLVEACATQGFDVLINTGTSSEYGGKDRPMREEDWLDPNSYYAVAKAAATQYCRFAARSRRLPILTLRPFSVYGPWEEPSRLIPALALHLQAGALPPLVSPDTARDFVHVEDVVDAYRLAAEHPELLGEVINVGTGIQHTIRDVVELAVELTGVKATPQWSSLPARSWDTTRWLADPSKAKRLLGWTPSHSLRAGLAESLAWFRTHRDVYAQRMPVGAVALR